MSEAVQDELISVETGEEPGAITIESGQAIERPGGRTSDWLGHHRLAGGELFIVTDTRYKPREGGVSDLAEASIFAGLRDLKKPSSQDLVDAFGNAHSELVQASSDLPIAAWADAGAVLVRQHKADVVLTGSTQAFLVSKDGIKRFVSSGESSHLGVRGQEPQITSKAVVLEAGDLLILATDGVSDLGDEEILQTIQESGQNSARDIAEALTQKAVKKAALDPEQVSLGIPPDNASAFVIRAREMPAVPEGTWEDVLREAIELSENLEGGFNPQGDELEQTLLSYSNLREKLEKIKEQGRLTPAEAEDLDLILSSLEERLKIS